MCWDCACCACYIWEGGNLPSTLNHWSGLSGMLKEVELYKAGKVGPSRTLQLCSHHMHLNDVLIVCQVCNAAVLAQLNKQTIDLLMHVLVVLLQSQGCHCGDMVLTTGQSHDCP